MHAKSSIVSLDWKQWLVLCALGILLVTLEVRNHAIMWRPPAILLVNLALAAAGVAAAGLQQASPERKPLDHACGLSQARHVQAVPGWERANGNGFGNV